MSERTTLRIGMITAALVAGVIGYGLGHVVGREEGRAEMKRWQDGWYAAHPAVKEVYTFAPAPIVPQCRVGGYFQYNAKSDTFTCTPVPQPSKGKRKPKDDAYMQWDDYGLAITLPSKWYRCFDGEVDWIQQKPCKVVPKQELHPELGVGGGCYDLGNCAPQPEVKPAPRPEITLESVPRQAVNLTPYEKWRTEPTMMRNREDEFMLYSEGYSAGYIAAADECVASVHKYFRPAVQP